jgi:uncharacterized protein
MNTATAAFANANQKEQRPWYKHRWPWFIMFGPFMVVVAGFITMYIAYTRQDALVVDDYYKQGKAINQDLRRQHAAASMKLSADLRYDPAEGKLTGKFNSLLKQAEGNLVVRMVHSTQPEKDVVLDVKVGADGSFSVALPMLEKARWQLIIEDEASTWRLSGEWIWPQQRTASLKPLVPVE